MYHLFQTQMRSTILSFVLACGLSAQAQFALEHTYAGGSMINPYSNQFFLLELEASGWKYVRVDRVNMEVAFYHTDHTFWKSVPFSQVTTVTNFAASWDILYISEHLFDLDDGIEFMFTNYNPMNTPNSMTQVVDEENGQLLFSVSHQVPAVRVNVHQQQYPIRNTPEGTKLILSSSALGNDSAYVYGLEGELSTPIAMAWDAEATEGMPELFPNPTTNELMIRMADPGVGAVLEITASNGQVVMSRALNTPVTTLDVTHLAPGRYACRSVGGGRSEWFGSFVKY